MKTMIVAVTKMFDTMSAFMENKNNHNNLNIYPDRQDSPKNFSNNLSNNLSLNPNRIYNPIRCFIATK